jgi:hypothetical protein
LTIVEPDSANSSYANATAGWVAIKEKSNGYLCCAC